MPNETSWLIERCVTPPQWATERSPTGVGAFYSDIHRAYRFPTKQAAEDAMRRMSITPTERAEYFVSEHAWVDRQDRTPMPDVTQSDWELIAAILSAYHTTRLREADPIDHILSKDMVQSLLARHRSPDTARIAALEGENARLREANKVLRDGYADAVSGLGYVLQVYGRLSGVGFQRVDDHFTHWVTIPEREGLLAGSHSLPATTALGEQP